MFDQTYLKERLLNHYPIGPTIDGKPEFGFREMPNLNPLFPDDFVEPVKKDAVEYIEQLENKILESADVINRMLDSPNSYTSHSKARDFLNSLNTPNRQNGDEDELYNQRATIRT